MKLIIDIDEEKYRQIKTMHNAYGSEICNAIKNGTPVSTESDLISREALKKEMSKVFFNDNDDMIRIEKLIDNAPTVERPQGEWTQSETDRFYHTNNWECSNCHSIYVILNNPSNHNYNYCPNCGADMRGDKE